jgi:hypothetical protein
VPGGTRRQPDKMLSMACPAACGRNIRPIDDHQRPMGLVAPTAAVIGLARGVGLVTAEAFGHLPVAIVTGRAGELPMKARELPKLSRWPRMAGEASSGLAVVEGDFQGRMGLPMAGKARSGEMTMAAVAFTAGANIIYGRRMAAMAIAAGHPDGMGPPVPRELRGDAGMTFGAIGQHEHRRRFLFLPTQGRHAPQQNEPDAGRQEKTGPGPERMQFSQKPTLDQALAALKASREHFMLC